MKKLESTFINMVLVITIITLVAAGSTATLYTVTSEPIAQAKTIKKENAIKEVLTAYDRIDDAIEENDMKIYKAYQSDKFIGAAVEAISHKGFGGDIKMMIGFDAQGNIINYSVLEQHETPGLGTKMVDWFKTDKDNRSVVGKNPATDNLTVSKDGGSVDAITAATISSRAFLDAVTVAYNAYVIANKDLMQVDQMSGATPQASETDSIVATESAIASTTDSLQQQNN